MAVDHGSHVPAMDCCNNDQILARSAVKGNFVSIPGSGIFYP